MYRFFVNKLFLTALSAVFVSTLCAEITPNKLFSDNMVLQRGVPVKVWGKAAPNSEVSVKFLGKESKAKADADGSWALFIGPFEANSNPSDMVFSEDGKESKTAKGALVGEVWLTGGQSNMQFSLKGVSTFEDAKKRADYPLLRYFSQGSPTLSDYPLEDFVEGSKWVVCTPEVVGGFNAVAFFFGEGLLQELKIPVGIISTAVGSAPMRTWLPMAEMKKRENFNSILADHADRISKFDLAAEKQKAEKLNKKYEEALAAYKSGGGKKPKAPRTEKYGGPLRVLKAQFPEGHRSPQALFNTRINPAVGYAIKGVLWYEAEADAYGVSLETLSEQFEGFIDIYRTLWKNPKMPFVFVQLPSYGKVKTWDIARLKQEMVFRKVPGCFMVVSADTGNDSDIHPTDKEPVGKRCALAALDRVYKVSGTYSLSPFYESVSFKNGSAIVKMKTGGRGLEMRGSPRGFEVKVGSEWVEADARISGDSVILSPKSSPASRGKITAARYLFNAATRDNACLFNKDGLPAAPFNTEIIK